MRIAQIMFSDGWGGAERLFIELCTGLSTEGHEVLAVCKPGFKHGLMLNGQTNLHYATVSARCNWDYLSALRLKRLIYKFKPDVIHAHLARASWMAGFVGMKLNIPTISTTHNRIKKKYINHIGHFTTITSELKLYLEGLGVASDRITKIANFSSIEVANELTTERNDPLVFIALGRFVHKKGFDLLLKAFSQYVKSSTIPARLVLAGDGPLNQQLRVLSDQLGINHLVDFVGWVDDITSFFDNGDIFVLPSRDEPFGIVLLEAMARGKAIIATKVSGPLDFLDESTAFFVMPDNIEELSAVMQIAAADQKLCMDKASVALQRFLAEYTRPAILPQFEKLYTKISMST